MSLTFKNPHQWRNRTDYIVHHCTATPEGKPFTAADIHRMHLDLGWSGIGYHYLIGLDGKVEVGRPVNAVGSHVANYNSVSVGISYVGGVDSKGKPKDTRTEAQKQAMERLTRELLKLYPNAKVMGHRDFPGVNKACPCYDAAEWWESVNDGALAVSYTVQPGDTLWGISRKLDLKVEDLVALNDIHSPNEIYPGAVLKVA